jgi:4-hydroxy-tetrahydrodipicolinate reductase
MSEPLSARNPTLKLAVAGSGGRMGRALIEVILQARELKLCSAIEQSASPVLGKDAGQLVGSPCGVKVGDDVSQAVEGCDVMLDFTRPEGTLRHVEACRQARVKMVIGTTGFSEKQKQLLRNAARDIGIVFAPNMSVGVNLAFKLVETAAKVLAQDFDMEIIEAHHRHKVDAPSGTALRLGEVLAQATGRSLKDCAVYGREGATGERAPSTIGFSIVRGCDIVGDHTVLFAGIGERLEITHRAASRATFALGALRAARFVASQPAGLYDMQDVLGLR